MENSGILLVDDEPAYRAIVAALLPAIGVVDIAGNGADAVAAVRARRYDLILADIEMPGRDGYQAVADLRAAADWAREIPIIAFTTLGPTAGEQHFIDRGFDGLLSKPFAASDLIALARRWLPVELPVIPEGDRASQLADLLGREAADAMIDRMRINLLEAVEAIDAGGDERALGHRLGGLAGTLGFPALSAAWLALEHGGIALWPTARAITEETIVRLAVRNQAGFPA
ncbi:hypothetical protein ASE00_07270 [Sphingomonas sp. Root710]|uniref:response regulator n=1 Tax=Sphingomonas sp. Root710 TaxID=1736594 RepID=UPI0007021D08|nr:response regulator [Sphingomonas sp. Root710]KRB86491.1 hypothetical protein ASE00_07270 [Sphingomonas sp. Root710]